MSADGKEHRSFRRYPELHLFPRPEEATEALTRAKHGVMKSSDFWVFSVFVYLVLIAVSIGFAVVLARHTNVPSLVRDNTMVTVPTDNPSTR